jgi:hypothetical protein
MKHTLWTRRSFVASTAALGSRAAISCKTGLPPLPADREDPDRESLALRCAPVRVFKAADPGNGGTESWCLNLVLEAPSDAPWKSEELEITLRSGGAVVTRSTHVGAALAAIRTDLQGGRTPSWPFTLRIRESAPASAKIDSMSCALRVQGPSGAAQTVRAEIPLGGYPQKTTLLFPFRGHGLITQGGAADGGHQNRSGQFAVDAIGLTSMYAPQIGTREVNEDASGWGREILAPAAGVVVKARSDRPDQPVPGKTDPEFLLPEFRGGGDPGNHVVIDHENGEFSMIAHFQTETLAVEVGQKLAAGEPIGLLGNSGDSSFPHVHYQLMDGANWMTCDALPYRFQNMPARLVRGTWFQAKA